MLDSVEGVFGKFALLFGLQLDEPTNPVYYVHFHVRRLVLQPLLHIVENFLNRNAIQEIVQRVESLFDHLGLLVPELPQDVGKDVFDHILEVPAQSSSHHGQHFQVPNHHVKVAIVDQPFDHLADVSEFGVGEFRN